MKKTYITPRMKTQALPLQHLMAASNFNTNDFGGGAGDGTGATPSSLDTEFDVMANE